MVSSEYESWQGAGLVAAHVSRPEDSAEARDLYEKLWNREGTTAQAERWLARLREIAPRYFALQPGAYLELRVKARRPYDKLRARMGSRLTKRQLITLVRKIQQRDGTEEEREAWLWLVEESIPNVTISYRDSYRVPKEVVEHALASHQLIFGLRPPPLPAWKRALVLLMQTRAVRAFTAARARRSLRAPQDTTRLTAAQSLGELGDRRAVPALVRIAQNQAASDNLRRTAAQALAKIGDDSAVDPLARVMRNKTNDPDLRGRMAWALGTLGNIRALGPLVAQLQDRMDDLTVRSRAIRGLGDIRGPEATAALLAVAADVTDDSQVRSDAIRALVDLNNPPAYRRPPMLTPQDLAPPLIALLSDTASRVRYYAAYALYLLAAGPSPPELSSALDPLLALLNDEESMTRRQAAMLLSLIGDAQVLPALQEAAQREMTNHDTDWMEHQSINAAIKRIRKRLAQQDAAAGPA